MRQLSEQERRACSFQAKIFETSLTSSKSSSAVFVRRFMRSDYALRFDQGKLPTETSSPEKVIAEIDEAYGDGAYGSEHYLPMELHWMGYIYRYWCFAMGLTSKEVYKTIGARELRSLYYPYHTLDASQALERIIEAKQISLPASVSHGVEVLKRLRAEENGARIP